MKPFRKRRLASKYKILILDSYLFFLLIVTIFNSSIVSASEHNLEIPDDFNNGRRLFGIQTPIIDQDSNIIISGSTRGILPFEPLNSTNHSDVLIFKYSPQGSLIWEYKLNGSHNDDLYLTTLHPDGSILLFGTTESQDYPTTFNSFQEEFAGGSHDGFVSVLTPDGKLKWSTYIGGSGNDFNIMSLTSIYGFDNPTFDKYDNFMVVLQTDSPDMQVSENALYPELGGVKDQFYIKFSNEGDAIWSSYMGGNGNEDEIRNFFLRNDGSLHFYGMTSSTNLATTVNSYQPLYGGGSFDQYFGKLNPQGNLVWSSYYGDNSSMSDVWGGEYDSNNNHFVIGSTSSPGFPVTDDSGFIGGLDMLISKFDDNGNELWTTEFGGTELDIFENNLSGKIGFIPVFLVDSDDNLIVVAETSSSDIPLKNPFLSESYGRTNSYIVKYDKDGNMVFSSYIMDPETAKAGIKVQLDSQNNIIIAGDTKKSDLNPINSYQSSNGGIKDTYIIKLNPQGDVLWNTYFGGEGEDNFIDVSLDYNDNIYVLGQTNFTEFSDFRNPQSNVSRDMFLVKFTNDGQYQWSVTIGGEDIDRSVAGDEGIANTIDFKSLLVQKDGSVVILGFTNSKDFRGIEDQGNFTSYWPFITQIDKNGNLKWTRYVGIEAGNLGSDSDEFKRNMLILIISSGLFLLGSYFGTHYYYSTRMKNVLLNHNTEKILSPMFNSKPQMIYYFTTPLVVHDKNLHGEIQNEVPAEIYSFKDFLHPVKLAMLKLLFDNGKMTTLELRNAMGVTGNEVSNHVAQLKKKGHVIVEAAIVDNNIRTVISLEQKSLQQFKELKHLLIKFLSDLPDMEKYVEEATKIKNRSIDDDELYPMDN